MLKKEIIWREILFQTIEKNTYQFQQQILAKKFSFSLSTVFNALKPLREINAIQVSGKGFVLKNTEKLLYLWATQRKLQKDIIYSTFVSQPIQKIERGMPEKIIWSAFSAYKYKFNDIPSEYGQVYIYTKNLEEIKKRFPFKKGPSNLFVLKADKFLVKYGTSGTSAQIFVDIWNNNEWYANEFLKKLKFKFNLL